MSDNHNQGKLSLRDLNKLQSLNKESKIVSTLAAISGGITESNFENVLKILLSKANSLKHKLQIFAQFEQILKKLKISLPNNLLDLKKNLIQDKKYRLIRKKSNKKALVKKAKIKVKSFKERIRRLKIDKPPGLNTIKEPKTGNAYKPVYGLPRS